MKRRLLLAAVVALVGYGIGWSERSYGPTPVALLTLVAAVSWLAGSVWTCSRSVLPLTLAVAEAHRQQDIAEQERDDLAARLAHLVDGGTYLPVGVTRLPRQAKR